MGVVQGLVYHKATQQRVLGGTSGGGGGVRPKGFQSKGVTQGGEKCFHSGRCVPAVAPNAFDARKGVDRAMPSAASVNMGFS